MLFAEVISAFIDIVLCIFGIGNLLEIWILEIFYHDVIALLHEINDHVQTVKDRLIEYLLMHIFSLEYTADSFS